jgi:hypothetical protein
MSLVETAAGSSAPPLRRPVGAHRRSAEVVNGDRLPEQPPGQGDERLTVECSNHLSGGILLGGVERVRGAAVPPN